jgi:hypothetical protein
MLYFYSFFFWVAGLFYFSFFAFPSSYTRLTPSSILDLSEYKLKQCFPPSFILSFQIRAQTIQALTVPHLLTCQQYNAIPFGGVLCRGYGTDISTTSFGSVEVASGLSLSTYFSCVESIALVICAEEKYKGDEFIYF